MMLSEIRRFIASVYVQRRSYESCQQICERLPAYAEQVAAGRVPRDDRLMRRHLRVCPLCGDIFDGLLEALRSQ